MLQRKEKLTLVEIKPVDLTDKETGLVIKKFKYTFLNANNVPRIAWDTKEKYKERVQDTDEYVPDKSFEYVSEGSTFGGNLTWRLVV